MPQEYTLVARPVILSEHKGNVIPHGRPLSPIGTARSARPFFAPVQVKDSFTEEKHGDTISLTPRPPSTTYMDYQRSANENLMSINNNLSLMLKESFAGIDSICQKVRLCLLEATTVKPPENLNTLMEENLQFRATENGDTSTAEDLESCITESLQSRKSRKLITRRMENLDSRVNDSLSTCEEEAELKPSLHELSDIAEDVNEIAEIVEENGEDDEKKKEDKKKQNTKRTPSITPFFTILNPQTQSAESVGVSLIKSMTSKLGLSRTCTTENFQNAMREVEKLNNYEKVLNSMVEGIKKEIDECYAEFQRSEGETRIDKNKNGTKGTKKEKNKNDRPKTTSPRGHKRRGEFAISEKLKRFHGISKISQRDDITEDQYSDNELKDSRKRRLALSVFAGRMDFTCPDVYRKRAITDLHKRLEAQIEANDSLIFFQKLMAKNKKHMNNDRPISAAPNTKEQPADSNILKSSTQYLGSSKCHSEVRKERSISNLSKKYQDSLWFKQKKPELKRTKKESGPGRKRKDRKGNKGKQILPQSYTIESSISEGSKIGGRASAKTSHDGTTKANKASIQSPLKPTKQVSTCSCKIKITNDQPMSEAQKCKLHWMRAKYSQLRNRKLKYLDILDDISKNDLLPIQAEYPRRDDIKSTTGVKASYLYKLLYGRARETQNAWEQLFQPATKCSQENCQKCSATVIMHKDLHGKSDDKENHEQQGDFSVETQPKCDLDKGDVIKKLSKYIFLDEAKSENLNRIYTVMPVRVFYDNSRIVPENRKTAETPQKLPLIPMKETKELVKKAEWNDGTKKSKPMRVVYDPILRKIEKEIRMVAAKPEIKMGNSKTLQTHHSWSPKNFSRYCTPNRQSIEARVPVVKFDTMEKPAAQKQKNQQKSVPISELFKRSSKPSLEKVHHSVILPVWHTANFESFKPHKDADVKEKIQKTVTTEATLRMKSDHQRKIWENKFGKSVGQKLLNFIEKQPTPYELPVPKYAMPKAVHNPTRHQCMLEQLRTLKKKNDSIQTNIQKAIEVIENKMVDILSKPTTSQSIEAFDEMEKEITNVLSLMKTPSLKKILVKKEKMKTNDDYGIDISDELFHRLDRILESPGMSSSNKSSKNNLTKEERAKRRNKTNLPPKSTDMNQIRFSSTSATGEEKFTVTGISPKRPLKSSTKAPYIKDADTNSSTPDDASTISDELRKLENQLKLKEDLEVEQPTITEPDEHKTEPTPSKENKPIKRSSILKQTRGQDQVVNLALFAKEGSAGDQLQELKRLLENELKSVDASEEKTHSIIGFSYSQGDHKIHEAVIEEQEKKLGDDKFLASTELDVESVPEEEVAAVEPEMRKSEEECSPNLADDIRTIPEEIGNQMTNTVADFENLESPKETSQRSLETTGPYFTPRMSPLRKTRKPMEDDQIQCCPIIEEKWGGYNKECETMTQGDHVEDIGDQSHFKREDVSTDNSPREKGEDGLKENSQISEIGQTQVKTGDSREILYAEKVKKHDGVTDEEEKSEISDRDYFYENVNKIISRVENVYSQLEEFEEEMMQEEHKLKSSLTTECHTYDDSSKNPEDPETDLLLTPFVHAVKDPRKNVSTSQSRKSSPRRSSSLYNVLAFLDNLNGFEEERPVEVRTSRTWYSSYVIHIPKTFHQLTIQHQTLLSYIQTFPDKEPLHLPQASTQEDNISLQPLPSFLLEEPRKKSGCLKLLDPSRSTVNTVSSKSKQKVSFLLHKEEKATQVTSCLFHSVARMLSQQQMNNSTDTLTSSKKDGQVSAYLDAYEDKSVDKMSLFDDETTYQSTFAFSDENSSDKSFPMPEQIFQNLQESLEKREENLNNKKKVVEIFRNSHSDETRPAEIKVCPAEVTVFPAQNDIGKVESVLNETDNGVDFFSEKVSVGAIPEEAKSTATVKVFYDDFKSGQDKLDLKLICGFYNEESILQVKSSLSKTLAVKKRDSVEKLLKKVNEEIFKEHSLLEPIKDLNNFIDSKLLTEAVGKRQAIRMMNRKSTTRSVVVGNNEDANTYVDKCTKRDKDKENLIKGFYVFVYLLMFTALNLEYKCVQ